MRNMYFFLGVICITISSCGSGSKNDQKPSVRPEPIPQSSSTSLSSTGLSSISSLPNVISSASSAFSSNATIDHAAIRLCMGAALENADFTGYELITHFNICAGSSASSASFEAFSNLYINALAANHFQFSR